MQDCAVESGPHTLTVPVIEADASGRAVKNPGTTKAAESCASAETTPGLADALTVVVNTRVVVVTVLLSLLLPGVGELTVPPFIVPVFVSCPWMKLNVAACAALLDSPIATAVAATLEPIRM